MPKVVQQPASSSATPILDQYHDPYRCGRLYVSYDVHRFLTFPLVEKDRFKNQLMPLTLSQAGFYYGKSNAINCCGCPTSIHAPIFLSHVEKMPLCPNNIRQWHQIYAPYCRFGDIDIPVGNHWMREDCRLASLLKAKWQVGDLWQHMNILDLAKSGFYSETWLKSFDEVICFSCQIKVHGWEQGETPDEEHKKWSKDCPFQNARLQTGRHDVEGNFPIGTEEPRPRADVANMFERDNVAGITESCVYEKCKDLSYCKDSFLPTWPHAGLLAPAGMASAGFFYVNNLQDDGDRVACFKCGLTLESWSKGDHPLEIHRQISPSCNRSAKISLWELF